MFFPHSVVLCFDLVIIITLISASHFVTLINNLLFLNILRQADGQTAGRTDGWRLRLAARRQAGGKCRREQVGGEDVRGGPVGVQAR